MRSYMLNKNAAIFLLFVAILQIFQFGIIDGAMCKGSVTFYWKEVPAEMKSKQRNWGVLEKKLVRNYSKLSDVMDVENSYAFTVDGDCCWEVYSEEKMKGDSTKLVPKLTSGFAGVPGFPTFKANSLKKISC